MTDADDARVRAMVRDAFASAVAMMTREIESVDADVAFLLEGVDPTVLVRVLAAFAAALLGLTTPNGGRDALARIGLLLAEDEE